MGIEEIILDKPGKKMFLLGNEAVVRGFIEGGGRIAATYPGTPSSEIGNTLFKVAREAGIYFEFSTNEKVALEVAHAASVSGLRSIVFMKHVGLNVAADSFMSTAYTGVRGGFIVLSADDPSMYSSQNEQDNRTYARFSKIPLLEPRNPDEIRRMVKYAFEISEKHKIPVMIRTTTRISHMRGIVEFGPIDKKRDKGYFEKNPGQFVPVPQNARRLHKELIEKQKGIREESEKSPFNFVLKSENGKFGAITSSAASNYLIDVIRKYNLPIDILSIGFSHPLPENLIKEFIKNYEMVFVVEELEPLMENDIILIKEKYGIKTKIIGKDGDIFTPLYEYNPDRVRKFLFKHLNIEDDKKSPQVEDIPLPSRPPVLCPGCPHRATYFSVNKVLRKYHKKDTIFPSDIGCYTLGIQPPFNTADMILSMGASVGLANGFSKATDQPVVAFIGDSTFFHAGIPALINAQHNKNHFVLFVLDNQTTAMTGHQPHPGIPVDGLGRKAPKVSIEEIAKGIGIDFVKVVDPYNLKETQKVFDEALKHEGVSVIVARRECSLLRDARMRKEGKWITYEINQDKCTQCRICVDQFACPAIFVDEDGKVKIDEVLCDGCGVCADVCPFNAIEVRK